MRDPHKNFIALSDVHHGISYPLTHLWRPFGWYNLATGEAAADLGQQRIWGSSGSGAVAEVVAVRGAARETRDGEGG